MDKIRFKAGNNYAGELFPVSLDSLVPEKSPARLVSKIVDYLDLKELIRSYKIGGSTAYNPRTLLKIVFFAYMNNIYSCRKIEKLLRENILYMWLSQAQKPSFSTINRFRSEHLKNHINTLFVQVVKLLVQAGQLTLETQYIDGTKIESVANKYTFVWKKNILRFNANLDLKIRNVLQQIDTGIAQDTTYSSDEVPEEISLSDLEEQVHQINDQNLSQTLPKAKKKAIKQLNDYLKKKKEYTEKLDILKARNSFSKTDPEATFMHMKEDAMKNGQTKPGYNIQIATEHQYITNIGLYPNPTDTRTFAPFMTLFYARYNMFPKIICADSGYGSEENYDFLDSYGMQGYVKYNYFHKEQKRKYKEDPFLSANFFYNAKDDYYVCPMGQHLNNINTYLRKNPSGYVSHIDCYRASNCKGCPLRCLCYKSKLDQRSMEINHKLNAQKKRARELLLSEEGRFYRGRRCVEPEAVFGQIKNNKQYRRFRHKGFDKVQMDFAILAMSFNLEKYIKYILKTGQMDVLDLFLGLFLLFLPKYTVAKQKTF